MYSVLAVPGIFDQRGGGLVKRRKRRPSMQLSLCPPHDHPYKKATEYGLVKLTKIPTYVNYSAYKESNITRITLKLYSSTTVVANIENRIVVDVNSTEYANWRKEIMECDCQDR
jgi:hypothetical protein